jgi:hypothetical protein
MKAVIKPAMNPIVSPIKKVNILVSSPEFVRCKRTDTPPLWLSYNNHAKSTCPKNA